MLNVTYENISQIKRLNLPEILQSKGIHLKRNSNGSYIGQCPFHDDKNPSLSASLKNDIWLWHCFGCHKGGTLIDFLRLLEGRTFKEIYKDYSKTSIERPVVMSKDIQSVLNQIIRLYHNILCENDKAQEYLKARGLLDRDLINTFKLGYSNGAVLDLLPNDEAIKSNLKDIGILNEKGNESFYKSITVPIFDENENALGLYGRNIERKSHLYLKGPHKGIFNHKAIKAFDEVILTEALFDALTLYKQGFKNVTSSYGTNGFTGDHLKAFKENKVERVYIAYDNDTSGETQTVNLAKDLTREGFEARRIRLPEGIKDINDYFRYNRGLDFIGTYGTFANLIKEAKKIGYSATQRRREEGLLNYEDGCANFRYADVLYEIKGIDIKSASDLRVVILAERGGCRHQDRLDLYSAKTRGIFVNHVSKKFNLDKTRIEENLLNIIEGLENIKRDELDKAESKPSRYQMTDEEEKEAKEFLKSSSLIDKIVTDIEKAGYVGERVNKEIAYLAATSRKLEKPLSCIIISQSSSGKSHLMETIACLMPDEEVEFYSRITPQSLYYMGRDDLKHKLLIVDERSGSEEADYAVRTLQTRHRLTLAYPVKDPNTGRMKTIVVEMSGPISFIESSTKEALNPENTSRSFQLYLDESEEQTKKVQEYQRFIRSLDGWKLLDKRASVIRIHNNAQRLLKPIKIIIPFIDRIKFPSRWIRTRRDQDRFLSLIEAVTFLYQYQRPIKQDQRGKPYIESSLKDYEIAYNLAGRALLDTLEDLQGSTKAFYEALETTIKRKATESLEKFTFKRRDAREWMRLPDHYVKRKLAMLEELEYVSCERSYKGGSFTYRFIPRLTRENYISGLTHPKDLQKSGT